MDRKVVLIKSGYEELFTVGDAFCEDLARRVADWTCDTDVSVTGVLDDEGLWYISQVIGLRSHYGSGRTCEESLRDLAYILETHFDIVDRVNGEG